MKENDGSNGINVGRKCKTNNAGEKSNGNDHSKVSGNSNDSTSSKKHNCTTYMRLALLPHFAVIAVQF